MEAKLDPPAPAKPDVILRLSHEEAETLLYHAYHALPGGRFYTQDLIDTLSAALGMTPRTAIRVIQ